MSKGTCLSEAILNSENIKTTALAIIKLDLSEGIKQSGIQKIPLKKFEATNWKHFNFGHAWLYLTNTAKAL